MTAKLHRGDLSYASLRCVLSHFEANFRLQLVAQLPQIRAADKAVPLKIEALMFSNAELCLNDTKYRLGIICKSREGKTPWTIENDNKRGGLQHELNIFGLQDSDLEMATTPGDIALTKEIQTHRRTIEEIQVMRDMEERVLRQELERRAALDEGREPVIFEDVPADLGDLLAEMGVFPAREEPEDPVEQRRLIEIKIRNTEIKLEYCQLTLDGLIRERDNVPSPFDMYIQNLAAAQKYLITKILGNRSAAPNINYLSFWPKPYAQMVLRLPEGLKLRSKEFSLSGIFSETWERVRPILEDVNNCPYNSLEIGNLDLKDCVHPIVQNAKVLYINAHADMSREADHTPTLRAITNKKFVANSGGAQVHYGALIDHWKDVNREIGTCFKFYLQDEEHAQEALRMVRESHDVEGERLLKIQLSDSTQLNFSYEAVTEHDETGHPWVLKMEVVPLIY